MGIIFFWGWLYIFIVLAKEVASQEEVTVRWASLEGASDTIVSCPNLQVQLGTIPKYSHSAIELYLFPHISMETFSQWEGLGLLPQWYLEGHTPPTCGIPDNFDCSALESNIFLEKKKGTLGYYLPTPSEFICSLAVSYESINLHHKIYGQHLSAPVPS